MEYEVGDAEEDVERGCAKRLKHIN